jgi:hypothetical protein
LISHGNEQLTIPTDYLQNIDMQNPQCVDHVPWKPETLEKKNDIHVYLLDDISETP